MALYAATSCGLCHMACEPGSYMQILPQFIPLTSNRFQHKSVFVSQWWWFSSESVSLESALMLELTRFFLVCNLYFYYFFHLILIRVGLLLSTGALRTYCSGLWGTKRCLICHSHLDLGWYKAPLHVELIFKENPEASLHQRTCSLRQSL